MFLWARGRNTRRLCLGAAVAALCAVAAWQGAAAAPSRVVSIHLCADQLLLALADRSQIVSVSHFARDETRSPMAGASKEITVNRGRAEEAVSNTHLRAHET